MNIRIAAPLLAVIAAVSAQGQLSVTPGSLPNGVVGAAYNQTLVASGGTAPYSWTGSTLSGSGSAGLSFTAGAITGTPTAAGPVTVSISLTDSTAGTPLTLTTSIGFNIAAAVAVTAPTSLAAGTVGVAYGPVTFTASGGTGTGYTWSATGLPANLSLSAAGVLSGTPAAGTQGPHTVNVTVTDSGSNSGSSSLPLTINLPTLAITAPTSLAAGTVGTAYGPVTFTATGGTGTGYAWSATGLPANLSLSPAGVLSGTPAAGTQGPHTVNVTVTDSGSNTGSSSLSLTINLPTLAITAPTSLAAGTVGAAYGPVTFTATGGTGTGYTWSATGLPANLSLSAAGVLSGTPAAGTQGPHTVNVTVTDSASNTGTNSLSLTINLPTLTITAPTTLAAGTVGVAYTSVTFTATGGTGTGYTWSQTGLPTGMSLSTAGVLSGTPGAGTQGPHTVNVTVTDSASNTDTNSLSLTINLPTLTITAPTTLAAGTVGVAYGPVTFTATGGTGTGYTWSQTGLPTGMSLSAAGVLSGTPAAGTQGPHTVNVTVTDSASNTDTNSLSLTINLPTLTITAPTSLAAGTVGVAYTSVTFTATGGTGTGYTWSQTGLPAGMSLSTSWSAERDAGGGHARSAHGQRDGDGFGQQYRHESPVVDD